MKIDPTRLPDNDTTTTVGATLNALGHRLNNVIQGINGGAHLVDMGFERGDVSIAQQGWGIVKRNQEMLGELIADLLELGKPILLEPESVPVIEIVDLIKATCETAFAGQARLGFHTDVVSNDQKINADREGVVAIVENFFKLVCFVSEHESSEIAVSVAVSTGQDEPDALVISFAYIGAVVCRDVAELKHWFNRPVHAKAGGVAFALLNKIAALHGGKLTIAEPSGDEGSRQRIDVTLPLET